MGMNIELMNRILGLESRVRWKTQFESQFLKILIKNPFKSRNISLLKSILICKVL